MFINKTMTETVEHLKDTIDKYLYDISIFDTIQHVPLYLNLLRSLNAS
jgi:hypothetical protein